MASPETRPAAVSLRRRLPVVPALLFFTSFVVYYFTTARNSLSMDVWAANYASWLIATTGQPWMDGLSVPALDDLPNRGIWVMEADNGHTVIGRSPGVVAASLPAYWLFMPSEMTIGPASLTTALLAAVTVLLVYLTIRSTAASAYALPVAVVLGFTTPVWSIAADGMWPHTITALGIAGMAWAASTERWWLVGLFGGVALWGRLHVALIVALFGLAVAGWRRRPGIMLKVGIPSASMLVLMMAWTRWMYGTWNPMASYSVTDFTGYASTNRLDIVNHLGFWISPDRGLFVWTPVVLLLLPATVRHWRELPDWSRALVWGGLFYTLVQLTLNRFSGGDAFYGYRLGLELLLCLTPAIALGALRTGPVVRRLLLPVVGLQLAVIYIGARYETFHVAAEDVWTQNAFVVAINRNPVVVPVLVIVAMVVTLTSYRIWLNPRVESLWGRGRSPQKDGEVVLAHDVPIS